MTGSILSRRLGAFCAAMALGLAAIAPVQAAEWDMTVGGYVEQHLAYASYDSPTSNGFDGGDAVGSAEFFFLPSVTLGSGLRFGGNFALEGHAGEHNARMTFDRAEFYVAGRFGSVTLGKSDTPGNAMWVGGPESQGAGVTYTGVSSGALASLIPFANVHGNRFVGDDVFRGTLGSTRVSNMGADTQGRVSYFSPRMGGLQLGLSYAHESPGDFPARRDFFDLGANYVNRFGAVDFAASASYGIADSRVDPTADPEYYGAGVQLGYGGFTLGGSWAESRGSSGGISDGSAYEIGLTYDGGRYQLSANFLSGSNIDDENAALGARERLDAFTLGGNYRLLGPEGRPKRPAAIGAARDGGYTLQQGVAVDAFGYVSYVDFAEDVGDGGTGTPGDDVDGFVIGTGIRVSF